MSVSTADLPLPVGGVLVPVSRYAPPTLRMLGRETASTFPPGHSFAFRSGYFPVTSTRSL
jgi:hypothetical protein